MFTFGLIGYGKWGKNYFKILNEFSNKRIINFLYLARLKLNKKSKQISSSQIKLINTKSLFEKKINGLIISSPPQTHFELSKKAISKKIPTLIEKPLTLNLESTLNIKKLLYKKKILFLVNHQYLMSPYYKELKKIINNKNISKIYSEGHGIGPKRNYSVLWDWAPHDLSMIFDLLGTKKRVNILKVKKNTSVKGFERWKIEMYVGNIFVAISIGNNYKRKTRIFKVFEKNGNITIFNDRNISNYKLKFNNKCIRVQHSLPLQNKILIFLKYLKKYYNKNNNINYMKDINLSLKIAKCIEKIYYFKD